MAALIENVASEVGIAIFDPFTTKITVAQIADNFKFSRTLKLLEARTVKEVIFSKSLQNTNFH